MTISCLTKNNNLHKHQLTSQLQAWANINTGSDNISGLLGFCSMLKTAFASLGGTLSLIPLPDRHVIDSKGKLIAVPSANALHIVKRPEAKLKILFGGHMDTVFSLSNSFQQSEIILKNKLQGPGVADMKGGLLILLKGLEIFESSLWHNQIGWEVLITPDEEIGSVCSKPLWVEASKRNQLCLIFEPSYPDGALISSRKGSMNIALVINGKAAHVGREFLLGRNAIVALSQFIIAAHQLNASYPGITLNVGTINSCGSANIVADLAICHMNIRADKEEDLNTVFVKLEEIAGKVSAESDTTFTLHKLSHRAPKIYDAKTEHLFNSIKDTAQTLGIDMHCRSSGGVCDGNIVAAQGIPTIDTMGAVGDHIHTDREFIFIDSLAERAHLLSLFLLQLASNQKNIKDL